MGNSLLFWERFSPFLKEIKKRLVALGVIFGLTSVAGFVFYERIIEGLIVILDLKNVNIVFTSPFQFINLSISCGLIVGLIFTIPLVIFHILRFLKPALSQKEYRVIVRFVPFSLLLFIIGFGFGAMMMKWQIVLFLSKSLTLGVGNILDISGLLNIVLLISTLMGVSFEFPIILLILLKTNLISRKGLANGRMWVYLGTLIFVMLMPIDSVIVDLLMALPLVVLYELTLLLSVGQKS